MILKASQRAGGIQLARHLLNTRDNDHVTIHSLRGFVADNLFGALKEAHAVSRGTKCRQFLFSLSLNPPDIADVPVAAFEEAIARIEKKLGLSEQPSAVVFHEKSGRRHAHCVWSRIDANDMKSINLSHFKMKLQDVSRELYLEHGWDLPPGLQDKELRDPLNFSHGEKQQANRVKQDPRELKQIFLACWEQSDSQSTFAHALKERGFILAKGDRRGHVVVDRFGEVYALSRWLGIKAKEVRARLGLPDGLPKADEALALLNQQVSEKLHTQCNDAETHFKQEIAAFEKKRQSLAEEQRIERSELLATQQQQLVATLQQWQEHPSTGLKAVWEQLSGSTRKRETERAQCLKALHKQHSEEQQTLIQRQLRERRALRAEAEPQRFNHALTLKTLNRAVGRSLQIDPAQPLILPSDNEVLRNRAKVLQAPEAILDIITDKDEYFTRNAVVRGLARYFEEPQALQQAIDHTLQSDELVQIRDEPTPRYTTRSMQALSAEIREQAKTMDNHNCHGIAACHVESAIETQNTKLQQQVGTSLSDEQDHAIRHVLGKQQLSVVVGLAGAGKSTLLAAAHQAWAAQGYRVVGAALSGKAADGLQSASSIESRTLASWAMSWKNGTNTLKTSDVLVLDEAGMVSSRQMLDVIRHVTAQGAKLVLVGDPEQLQPINAGTPLRDISQHINVAELSKIRRQRSAWQREASLQLARGQTTDALAAYNEKGAVHRSDDQAEAIESLARDYLKDESQHGNQSSRLALAHRRVDVHKINQTIRASKKQRGDFVEEFLVDTIHGPRAFAIGERILLTKNDRDLRVRNGMLGTVERIDDKITLLLDRDNDKPERRISFSPESYPDFDHGYATTIHKSQGVTVDHNFVLASKTMDKHLTYVAMTRHKHSAKFYLADSEAHRHMWCKKFEKDQKKRTRAATQIFH